MADLLALDGTLDDAIRVLRKQAMKGMTDDRMALKAQNPYIKSCQGYHPQTGSVLTFVRCMGKKGASRCWELSIDFIDPITGTPLPRQNCLTHGWLTAAFLGKEEALFASRAAGGGWKYRLFVDTDWMTALKPEKSYGWLRWMEAIEMWAREAL